MHEGVGDTKDGNEQKEEEQSHQAEIKSATERGSQSADSI